MAPQKVLLDSYCDYDIVVHSGLFVVSQKYDPQSEHSNKERRPFRDGGGGESILYDIVRVRRKLNENIFCPDQECDFILP